MKNSPGLQIQLSDFQNFQASKDIEDDNDPIITQEPENKETQTSRTIRYFVSILNVKIYKISAAFIVRV